MREILDRERMRAVPPQPGVYVMTGSVAPHAEPRVLYVGKSINLRRRLASYRSLASNRASRRLVQLAFAVESVTWETCADDHAARLRENQLLRLHRPKFNSANTHPESHWFAALRAGEGFFELARVREPEGAGDFFGAFKQAGAFAVLLRVLWVALHPPESVCTVPESLFSARPRASFRFDWPAVPPDDAGLPALLTRLKGYLDGSSPELIAWLRTRLESSMAQSPFARAWLTVDLETLENFFTRAIQRNAELRRRFNIAGSILHSAELDDLLALAEATRALRKEAGSAVETRT
jgi:hypothetical protein